MSRISVITPAWNAAATLGATVASVQAQTERGWEMLIIDDGSTDGSRELVARLAAEDPRIRPLALGVNGGPAAARNAGIRAARGRFIAFLDADDLWRPEKLEVQLGYMARTGAPLTFTAYRRIDAAGRPLGTVPAPARLTHAELLRGNAIGCLTAVYDSAALGKVEMPPLRRRQDYGLWLALLARGAVAHGLSQVLADYRVRPGSLSANRLAAAAATWTVYREVAGLSRARAGYCLAHNLARGIGKRLRPAAAR